jgi:Leucine-rich repeat (LRR) protein
MCTLLNVLVVSFYSVLLEKKPVVGITIMSDDDTVHDTENIVDDSSPEESSSSSNACTCCWSLETDSEGNVSSVRLVGWGGQETPAHYRVALHAICHLQKLQKLELARYPLSALPVCMQHLSHSLTTLIVDGAEHIREIPPQIGRLTNLETLTIKDCPHLRSFPVEVTQLPYLERLSFEGCYEINSVPPEIGCLGGSLTRLTIRDFHISSLPSEIGQLTKLEYLELADFGVDFKLLPMELGNCLALEGLYLELEYLSTLPASIGKLQNLTELITHGCCYLETIPREIKHCKSLQSLWLYDTDPDALVKFFDEPWDPEKYAGAPNFISLEKSLLGPAYKHLLRGLPSTLLELNLGGNEIDDLQGVIGNTLPEGLRTLALQENPAIEDDDCSDQLKTILQRYRKLGCIDHKGYREERHCAKIGRILNDELFHMMLMNQSARVLLENKTNKKVPLALWPTVMENVPAIVDGHLKACRMDFDRDEFIPSVIFSMLQKGPALLNAESVRRPPPPPPPPRENRKRKFNDIAPLLEDSSMTPLWDMFIKWQQSIR